VGKQFFTKIEFSHEGTKAQKRNATHFFASWSLRLRGNRFSQQSGEKNTSYCNYKRA